MNEPAITVLMPVYNAAQYIAGAIASVLAQKFSDFELLIINDGSTDETEQVIRSFTDDRIRFINQSNQGIAAALNMGLLNARAELIARFDADDICLPNRLALQYLFLQQHPDHVIVGCDADYIDMNGEHVFTCALPAHSDEEIRNLASTCCPFIHSSVLYRKDAIVAAGGYNIHAHAFEDHLLWTTLIKNGKAANLPQVLLQVRLNPGSVSIDEKWHTKRFKEIKKKSLEQGVIAATEGAELLHILQQQNSSKIKHGSYYSLLAKKYLWNNHQPKKARVHLKKAIWLHPSRLDSYGIMILSFFPKNFILWLYKQKVQKNL